jgi:O-antigen/teichoic acid export membrane protein
MVPMTIDYVNPVQYGIWLTLSSIIIWFNYFDIGLGNGLKNKVAEAIAKNEYHTARRYISTGYGLLAAISLLIVLSYLLLKPWLNWATLLNAPSSLNDQLNVLAFYLLLLFSIQFVFQLINTIFFALQKSALVSMVFLVGNVLSLLMLVILKATTEGSLLYLGLSLFFGNLISLIGYSLWFFLFEHPDLSPRLRLFHLKYVKSLLNLGTKFFIIQLAALVQYQTTNVIISRYFSPLQVTEYNIPFKLFGTFNFVFALFLTPLWSSVTEAYTKRDYSWIINTERKLLWVWRGMALVAFLVLLCCPIIYRLWINNEVIIPFTTSLGIMLYILTLAYGNIYVTILNGIGALELQFKLSVMSMFIFIPVTYLLAIVLNLGVFGICISLVICNFNGLIFAPLQYNKLIKQAQASVEQR